MPATAAPRSGPDPGRRSIECRVYERQPCDIPAKCSPASLLDMQDDGWNGVIRDISQGGVRMHLRRRFERGTGLALELPCANDEPMVLFVKVVHLMRESDGTWMLGCQFLSPIGDDLVDRLTGKVRVAPAPIEEEIEAAELAEEELEVAELATCEFELDVAELASAEFELATVEPDAVEYEVVDEVAGLLILAPVKRRASKKMS